ncbi:MAG: nitrile hydratase accessory protein [Sedimentitalea sp.]
MSKDAQNNKKTEADSAPPEPVFEEPWHALLFAMTVQLNETGRFTWPDWAARFSATLARHGHDRDLNGGEDYFNAWLETLEQLLAEDGGAPTEDVAQVKALWEAAYRDTPHGDPVTLDKHQN